MLKFRDILAMIQVGLEVYRWLRAKLPKEKARNQLRSLRSELKDSKPTMEGEFTLRRRP